MKFQKKGKYIVTDIQISQWQFDNKEQIVEVIDEYKDSFRIKKGKGNAILFSKNWRYTIKECLNPQDLVTEHKLEITEDTPHKKQLRKEITDAIVFLRTQNQTIPSETIEFIRKASFSKLEEIE